MQIRVDSNWLDDFREGSPIKLTTERVDEVMGGELEPHLLI